MNIRPIKQCYLSQTKIMKKRILEQAKKRLADIYNEKISVQILSDIHLEFMSRDSFTTFCNIYFQPKSNICVLAGDIGNPFNSMYDEFLHLINYQFKKTFIIAGNHEYYGSTISDTNLQINKLVEKYPNISFLNNSFEDYEGIRWIGTTLWTHIKPNPSVYINDMNQIKNFDIEQYNYLHMISSKVLKSAFEDCIINAKRAVVITHHMPMERLVDEKFKTNRMKPYNQWFVADMDDFINENKSCINAWIYGHTHTPSMSKHFGIPFCCNPLGYQGENNSERDINVVVEISKKGT